MEKLTHLYLCSFISKSITGFLVKIHIGNKKCPWDISVALLILRCARWKNKVENGQLCFHPDFYQQKPTAARTGRDDFHKDWLLSESKQLSGGITSPTQTPQSRAPFP